LIVERREAAWTGLIALCALALLVLAVLELVDPGRGETMIRPAAENQLLAAPGRLVTELHRLLPDATDQVGRPARLDGTVVGQPAPQGFWVRDLRDNIVFVGFAPPSAPPPALRAGSTVRVWGKVALFPTAEQIERLNAAGLVLSANAIVVRDVQLRTAEGGVELLVR
jgi:hypothetical protein